MFLSESQLVTLTGRQRPAAQRRALERMGIAHHVRPDGRPVVTMAQLEGHTSAARSTPNWSALATPGDRTQ